MFMGVYRGLREYIGVYGSLWINISKWVSMGFYGNLCMSVGIYGCLWESMGVHRSL